MTHEKTFDAIAKLKDVEIELHRLKNALEMANRALDATPQRTWVGLTKEERHEISMANRPYCADVMAAHEEELRKRNT